LCDDNTLYQIDPAEYSCFRYPDFVSFSSPQSKVSWLTLGVRTSRSILGITPTENSSLIWPRCIILRSALVHRPFTCWSVSLDIDNSKYSMPRNSLYLSILLPPRHVCISFILNFHSIAVIFQEWERRFWYYWVFLSSSSTSQL